ATQHNTGLVRLWDAATGKLLVTLPQKLRFGRQPAFSPDGTRLLLFSGDDAMHYSGEPPTIHVFDAAAGRELFTLRKHQRNVSSRAFSPDGRRLATTGDGTACLWDTATGHLVTVLQGFPGATSFAAFSPDGTRLAVLAGTVAHIWDPQTRELKAVLK